jgi:hypothetical protein
MMLEIPVRCKPAERINMAHTITVAELLKPESAWAGETRPVSARATKTNNAVKSVRINPVAKRRIAINKIIAKIRISGSIKNLQQESLLADWIISIIMRAKA